MNITENQFHKLLEWNRKKIAYGADHSIYDSRFSDDYVAKTGDIELIKYYSDVFEKHPQIFPIVFKSGMYKKQNGEKQGFMLVEKLDADSFYNMYDDFWSRLDKKQRSLFRKYLKGDNALIILNKFEKELQGPPDYTNFIRNFINVTNQLYQIIDAPDIHEGNFGFDTVGNIKCLDF